MEFTKAEKRLLNVSLANEKRDNRALLLGGIFFAAMGIGVLIYGYLRIVPSVETTFKELKTSISMIQVQTKHEGTLKQMLLEMTKQLTKDQTELAERKINTAGFDCLWIALILITTSYWGKTYRSLIRKLKSSEPPLV
jgi:hypothetical protein